jgi:hypothetical protein
LNNYDPTLQQKFVPTAATARNLKFKNNKAKLDPSKNVPFLKKKERSYQPPPEIRKQMQIFKRAYHASI